MRRGFEARFPKIIARTPEEKKKAKEILNKKYLEEVKNLKSYEIPKTKEDLYIIENMQSAVQKIIKKHGGHSKLFPEQRILLLKPYSVEEYTYGKGDYKGAFFDTASQYIASNRTSSDTETALYLTHELFHAGSPAAVKSEERGITSLWSGIITVDAKNKFYFGETGEGIIAELTNQVYQKEIKKNPFYKKEVEANEKILHWLEKISNWRKWNKERKTAALSGFYAIPEIIERVKEIEEGVFSNLPEEAKIAFLEGQIFTFLRLGRLESLSGFNARVKLAELVNRIYEKSKEPEVGAKLKEFGFEFKNRQQIFDQFARATFTANPLLIRKIIEGALGKDSFGSFVEKSKAKY